MVHVIFHSRIHVVELCIQKSAFSISVAGLHSCAYML